MIEIKSFSVIDGQADGDKVAAAVIQSAVYVLAMRDLLAEIGIGPEAVADEVILVCPENFANRPVAAKLDVRKQLTVLRRQLARLERIDSLLESLPADITFDVARDVAGNPLRDMADLARAVSTVDARYAPECLASCEMCFLCRHETAAATVRLGRSALEELGGVDSVATVLCLARREIEPADDQAEAARLLVSASRLRAELLGDDLGRRGVAV